MRLSQGVILACALLCAAGCGTKPDTSGEDAGSDPCAACDSRASCNEGRCVCPAGYADSRGDGTSCDDVDECAMGTHDCHANASCSNAPGSFSCVCRPGFNGDGKNCTSAGPCTPAAGGCHALASCVDAGESYACQCPQGYAGDGVAACNDVNECAANSDNCAAEASCTNIPGTFTCSCPSGYANPNGDGTLCTDQNECVGQGTGNDCGANAGCTNTPGAFRCACDDGFAGDGGSCADIDECTANTDNCSPLAPCINSAGSYSCGSCPSGYAGDGGVCADIDECATSTDNCDPLVSCTNSDGGFACGSCPTGYGGDGGVCADFNECAGEGNGNDCDPQAACTNSGGAFSCACLSGYAGDGGVCSELDECALGTDDCSALVTCTNTVGSFMCGSCPSGYAGDGGVCADYDECAGENGGNNCSANGLCQNDPGSYSCTCQTGYSGNGFSCVDVDECTDGLDNCSPLAACNNTPGAFSCACMAGYGGDGVTCADLDECAVDGGNTCASTATCTNSPGSFSCACPSGFAGDGGVCNDYDECVGENGGNDCAAAATCTNAPGTFRCACNSGYVGDGGTCDDRDECAPGGGNDCSPLVTCTNMIGGFSCGNCPSGYAGDGGVCNDYDECNGENGGDDCAAEASCTNTPGTFRCACVTGYSGDGGVCNDVDECAPGGGSNCSAQASCANSSGSFSCTCNSGYAGNGVTCTDINECTTNADNCDPLVTCTNTPGAFSCGSCPPPYIDVNGNGTACQDACAAGLDQCDSNATCSASTQVGGYSCACSTAYVGDGYSCTAKTSCAGNPTACGANAACSNGVCTCNAGYAGDGTTCVNACFPGAFGQCLSDAWFGVAGSEFGPWSTYLTAGSAWGPGASGVIQQTNSFRGVAVAADNAGGMYIAFAGDNAGPSGFGTYLYQTRRYDSASQSWKSMDDAGFAGTVVFGPIELLAPSSGNPVAVFGAGAITVKTYNGSSWTTLPGSSANGRITGYFSSTSQPGYVEEPAATLSSTGYPVVTWSARRNFSISDIKLMRYTGSDWEQLGGSAEPDGGGGIGAGFNPTVEVDSNDRPVVAWMSGYTAGEILAARWNGTAWEEVGAGSTQADAGGVSSSPAAANDSPDLVMRNGTEPIVAYTEGTEIFVKRFDGTSWVEFSPGSASDGGISNTPGSSALPSIALLPSGDPIVAWQEQLGGPGTRDVYVRRFNGVSWVEDDGSASDGGISRDSISSEEPRITVDSVGRPVVAWHNNASFSGSGSQIFLKRLEGGVWRQVPPGTSQGGALSDDAVRNYAPSLILDRSERPIVAYVDSTSESTLHVKRYVDAGWVEIGAFRGNLPALELGADGVPLLAYEFGVFPAYEIHVVRYAGGTSWEPFGFEGDGGVSDTPSRISRSPSIALDLAGRPVVSWTESVPYGTGSSQQDQILLKAYRDGGWVELAGSATGDGLSSSSTYNSTFTSKVGRALVSSVAVDPSGRIGVAWDDDRGSGNSYVYYREYSPSSGWSGTSTATGLLQRNPTVMFDSAGVPHVSTHYWTSFYGQNTWRLVSNGFGGFAWNKLGYTTSSMPNADRGRDGLIVRDGNGRPISVWGTAFTSWEILTQRWNGTAWVAIGAGSNSGGGISNSQARSSEPAAAVRGNTLCVAWVEPGPQGEEIALRCNYSLP